MLSMCYFLSAHAAAIEGVGVGAQRQTYDGEKKLSGTVQLWPAGIMNNVMYSVIKFLLQMLEWIHGIKNGNLCWASE